jgi:[protein-PII] uridylyltransferase
VVAARDRRGLFADLAMTISALGGNVVGARIFTSSNQEALDIFYVQDSGGQPFGGAHADRLGRLELALEAAARGEPGLISDREPPVFGRASAFAIAATVTVDNDASQDSTVIEASGRDRPRLLEALARTLSEADLSIQSAHVDGHGERAVDAFYIVDSKGAKLTDRKRVGAVRTRLLEVLEAADPGSKPRRLPTARASPAR